MDANLENNEQLRNSGTKSSRVGRKRGRNLAVITLLFILIAVGVALAYFLFWQYEEETEDAYVAGHLVQITPQVTGTVRKVMYDDTDVVQKGDVMDALDDKQRLTQKQKRRFFCEKPNWQRLRQICADVKLYRERMRFQVKS